MMAGGGGGFASTSSLTTLFVSFCLLILSRASLVTPLKGVDIENPAVDVTPYPLPDQSSTHDPKHVLSCERVQVSGLSRLKLGSYASSFRVTLAPSTVIPERLHSKIQVCFHRNASRGLCQCEKDEWKAIQKGGIWNYVMSPYEDRYVDVKFVGKVSGPVSVAVLEDFQGWRLFFLASAFVLLLLAPIVFHCFSFKSCFVMQGMKLLPTGRKNVFYLSIYGSVFGAGSFLLHHFSMLVHSLLENFGLSVEMHTSIHGKDHSGSFYVLDCHVFATAFIILQWPFLDLFAVFKPVSGLVSILLLLLITIAGAALGFWVVRKFVISEDGTVDVGIAQFVKWSMRIIATTAIFQVCYHIDVGCGVELERFLYLILLTHPSCIRMTWSTHDNLLALGALISFSTVCYLVASPKWLRSGLQRSRRATKKHGQAEFLSRSPIVGSGGKLWNSPKSHKTPSWSNSPVKGVVTPSSHDGIINQEDFYSTFHRTGKRRRFTKQEWEDFTRESTREAVAELASSPEFTDWIIEHADRIKLVPSEDSSDESMGSEADSTDENLFGSCSRFSFFSW
ncbi:hypothetical protein JRO89_XS04G0112300 [Xanthoceras sorbifolium]|uniref:Transmembrane protein n=1 Tax=Xanthoceras sorbifolium TaxID=99658 RepID=A0ABQ8I4U6_9ROSI|nr:hypothetical protein JRO89_XS04G0112300 [Xanthoceras sorbifolium]